MQIRDFSKAIFRFWVKLVTLFLISESLIKNFNSNDSLFQTNDCLLFPVLRKLRQKSSTQTNQLVSSDIDLSRSKMILKKDGVTFHCAKTLQFQSAFLSHTSFRAQSCNKSETSFAPLNKTWTIMSIYVERHFTAVHRKINRTEEKTRQSLVGIR